MDTTKLTRLKMDLTWNKLTNMILLSLICCIAIVIPTHSYEFIRQYPTFPNHVARPKFTIQPADQDVNLGGKVQIRCAGEASPSPTLFWYKEGHRQLLFAPGLPNPRKQSALDWPQAAALAAPDYRFGSTSDTSPAVNKLFSMPDTPDHVQSVTGYGNEYFGDRIYVDNQGSLNIINATTSDSGYYACALISSVGSILAKAKVNVRSSHSSSTSASNHYESLLSHDLPTRAGKFDLLPPPVIKFGGANQTLPVNTSATLVCEVVSQVAYKIQWLFESQPLQEDSQRVVVLDTGTLSISEVRLSDTGVYTCVVTAANDQMMPLAAPFEPLDSSMLTSAPPIQQTTSHSTFLKIASPMNPNIQFYKMDPYIYPSSPGPAYLISNNGNDAMTIGWSVPSDSGNLPIKEYIVEHYDTSQEHLGWRVIYRVKGRESLLIDGLSPDGSHFFVIRAVNTHGPGPSSAIAGPMRTLAGEARYIELQKLRNHSDKMGSTILDSRVDVNLARDRLPKVSTNLLSLIPASSTSIKVHWAIQAANNVTGIGSDLSSYPILGNVNDFIEGYSIRYRAIGMGESLLGKDSFSSSNWQVRDFNAPSSLPLVTSYVDEESYALTRSKREIARTPEQYKEVRVVDHDTEHYTINGLRPFTLYEFFVAPYYKDIDGTPSNTLNAQTNEDRPSIAPPSLTVRPINNTAIRLIWVHIPSAYTNGILRGYIVRMNRSDIQQDSTLGFNPIEPPKILTLPLGSLIVAPLSIEDNQNQPQSIRATHQQYVVMYDITDLNYKSFYSLQVAGTTNVGPGPWSESKNFIMDPKVLASQSGVGDLADVISKSIIPTPQIYSSTNNGIYLILSVCLLIVTILLIIGFLLYRRNNPRMQSWKKTISEHFNNKFYMPSTVDARGPMSIPQNIYDHQQHLIYSGPTHLLQQSNQAQTIWANNNCVNSSGTGSLSSHGGLIQVNNDPESTNRRANGDQMLVINKDVNTRFLRNNQVTVIANQRNADTLHQNQLVQHNSDYYSVINNMAEYEELDTQQRNNMQNSNNGDRIQTASSNSDTSCPSSVTRLLPNQPYNRDLLQRKNMENNRYDMILQQQVTYNGGKQPFVTMINGESAMMGSMTPLSPYATTNLMSQVTVPQHMFQNQQMIDASRQLNFMNHNGGHTMDDTSKILMNHQQFNGIQNQVSSFRTLQRNPLNFQSRGQPVTQVNAQQLFANNNESANNPRFHGQLNNNSGQFSPLSQQISTNISVNPLMDLKTNLYEHVDYSVGVNSNQHQQNHHHPTLSNEIISSSTSSGSVKSPSQQHSPDQLQPNSSKLRRGSANNNFDNEAHDLRVFSTQQRHEEAAHERRHLNGAGAENSMEDVIGDNDMGKIDETTAFKRPVNQGEEQRSRQLSKRRRQQQRNRLHNNNQKVG